MNTARATATLLLALLAACSLREPHLTQAVCNQDRQCHAGQVCFGGECRSPANALGSVMIEVTPPTNAPFAPVQQSLDLKASAVGSVQLPLPERVQGGVVQDGDPDGGVPGGVAQATVEFRDTQGPIPGRPFSLAVQTDQTGGFAVQLPPSEYSVRITPPPPLPPFNANLLPSGNLSGVQLHLPPASQLARVTGALKLGPGATPLAGARVTPVDRHGIPLGAPAITGGDGQFTLVLPPPPVTFLLRVGDASNMAAQAAAPLPSFDDNAFGVHTATAQSTNLGDLAVPALPQPATLSGKVIDVAGAPVAGAQLLAASQDGPQWSLSRSTSTGPDGTFSLALREGAYLVQAVPGIGPGQPALSGPPRTVGLPIANPLVIVCPPKVRAVGQVVRSDGKPVTAGAAITATRLPDRLASARAATTSATDAHGAFTLVGDPGSYRLEVTPSPESGQPRQVAVLELSAGLSASSDAPVQLGPIILPPPLVVVGTVLGPDPHGALKVVEGAAVRIFAIDAAGDGAVLLGIALTDVSGHFRVVVPDVSQPGSN